MSAYIFGYVRVSAKDQNLDRQRERILPLITNVDCLYEDKQSGKDFNRPKYQELKKVLREGDTLIITSLDRLGRNYDSIKEEWKFLCDKGVRIKVLDTPILDNTNANDDIAKLIANLTLEILSYVAESERKHIKQRQAEGIAIAKAKGTHMGRPKKELPDNWLRTIDRWEHKEITAREAMKTVGMGSTTFYKKYNEWKESRK